MLISCGNFGSEEAETSPSGSPQSKDTGLCFTPQRKQQVGYLLHVASVVGEVLQLLQQTQELSLVLSTPKMAVKCRFLIRALSPPRQKTVPQAAPARDRILHMHRTRPSSSQGNGCAWGCVALSGAALARMRADTV